MLQVCFLFMLCVNTETVHLHAFFISVRCPSQDHVLIMSVHRHTDVLVTCSVRRSSWDQRPDGRNIIRVIEPVFVSQNMKCKFNGDCVASLNTVSVAAQRVFSHCDCVQSHLTSISFDTGHRVTLSSWLWCSETVGDIGILWNSNFHWRILQAFFFLLVWENISFSWKRKIWEDGGCREGSRYFSAVTSWRSTWKKKALIWGLCHITHYWKSQ